MSDSGRGLNASWIIDAWLWAGLVVLAVPTFADPDLWGHLRFGLDLLASKAVRSVDRYSFMQDRAWVNHEWLSEVQIALGYRVGGVTGLIVLKVFLVVLGLAILARMLAHLPVLVRSGCLVLVTWAALPMIATIRPQLWTWLLTIVLGRMLRDPPSKQQVVPIAAIFAAWINLHGGVVVGAALLGIWAAYHVWASPAARGTAFTIVLAAAAATLCNPYGFGLWRFLGQTVRMGRDIREWRPIWQAPLVPYILPWALTVAALAAVAVTTVRVRIDRLAAILLFAYASQRTLRLVPLFALITVMYLTPSMEAAAAGRQWLSWRLRAPSRVAAVLALLPLIPFTGITSYRAWTTTRSCIPMRGDWVPDLPMAAAMRAAPVSGRLVTTFGWSQYAIWHFGPALRVSFDGRLETLYSDRVDRLHVAVTRGDPEGLAFLAQARPDYIWLSSASAKTREWVRNRGDYRIDLETADSFLAVRADRPIVHAVNDVPRACFPG